MKIIAAIIGMGIGQKHLDAIDNYKKSFVKIICEKNEKKIKFLKKKYPDKIITKNENIIFKDPSINLVSIASYDDFHYTQILKSLKNNKHIIVEKPMCLKFNQLTEIYKILKKKKNIKMTSNLVLRVNSLFKEFKKRIDIKNTFYIEADYIWGRKKKLFEWRSKVKDYSLVLGAGIHIIDLVMWLLGSKPISVTTFANKKSTRKSKFKKDSLFVMLFEFPSNILVKITANGAAVYNHFHEMKIFSNDETLVHSNLGTYSFKKNKLYKINKSYPDKENRKNLIQNFIDNLINPKIKNFISHQEQFDLMSVCFSAENSAILNKKIKIKYL